jgi:hypothetical protein
MSFGYDMGAYLEYTQKLGRQYDLAKENSAENDYDQENAAHSIHGLSAAAQRAIMSFADRSYTSFQFTPEGFEADSRITFK